VNLHYSQKLKSKASLGLFINRILPRQIDKRMAKKIKTNQQMQKWIEARRRRHLSHSQVQMARELGLNPAKLGRIDNHKQEPWKLPLPRFIEQLYFERFGKTTPDNVASIEERCRVEAAQREARRAARQQRAKAST
jgi:hypothetical protein